MRLALSLFGVASLAGALIWLAHLSVWGLKLNPEIKPIEVATLTVNIVIAVLIQYYFATQNQRQAC